jgi:hypothetical protein
MASWADRLQILAWALIQKMQSFRDVSENFRGKTLQSNETRGTIRSIGVYVHNLFPTVTATRTSHKTAE